MKKKADKDVLKSIRNGAIEGAKTAGKIGVRAAYFTFCAAFPFACLTPQFIVTIARNAREDYVTHTDTNQGTDNK